LNKIQPQNLLLTWLFKFQQVEKRCFIERVCYEINIFCRGKKFVAIKWYVKVERKRDIWMILGKLRGLAYLRNVVVRSSCERESDESFGVISDVLCRKKERKKETNKQIKSEREQWLVINCVIDG
jgi:hypothetical protein